MEITTIMMAEAAADEAGIPNNGPEPDRLSRAALLDRCAVAEMERDRLKLALRIAVNNEEYQKDRDAQSRAEANMFRDLYLAMCDRMRDKKAEVTALTAANERLGKKVCRLRQDLIINKFKAGRKHAVDPDHAYCSESEAEPPQKRPHIYGM